MVTTDRDIVLALRRGEPEALDELYGATHQQLWRFLVRLSGSVADAEDLFQETWLAAARHARRLREDTRLLPWLYTVAHNRFRNARRTHARRRQQLGELAAAAPAAAPDPDAGLWAERVAAAFSELPETYRETLLLCAVEELDTADVARVLGLTPEAVRKRLSRARAELARRVEGEPHAR